MTNIIQQDGKTYHQCGECKLVYAKKARAEECEVWCREHKSCNIEIIKDAVSVGKDSPVPGAEKAMKREARLAEQRRAEQTRKIVRFLKRGAVFGGAVVAVGVVAWYLWTRPTGPAGELISRAGIHWHPTLKIMIHGKPVDIPGGVGLGVVHNPVHTHEEDGVIHLEFPGYVRTADTRLGEFFEVWGKRFDRECILDACNGASGTVKMFVNGAPSEEFGDYLMKDKDAIEIKYEA